MRTIQREIVGVAILSKDNKVLLGKTAKDAHGVYSGSWVVPGGGIEPGESKLQALKREILEETNIDITPYNILEIRTSSGTSTKKLADTGEIVKVEMVFNDYKITISDKTAVEMGDAPTDELQFLRWFSSEELSNESVSPPTKDLLKAICFLN